MFARINNTKTNKNEAHQKSYQHGLLHDAPVCSLRWFGGNIKISSFMYISNIHWQQEFRHFATIKAKSFEIYGNNLTSDAIQVPRFAKREDWSTDYR